MVAPIDPATLEAAEAIAKSVELRHSEEAPRSRLVVADGAQTLVSLVLDDTRGLKNDRDIAIWTDSRDYGETMEGLYRVSFAKAEAAADRLAAVRGELKCGAKIDAMVGVVRTALAESGWTVESPGKIRSGSGVEYDFAAVLRGPGGRKVGVDVVLGQKGSPVADRVTASAMKKLDLKDSGLLIIASPDPDEQTKSLASLVGATVVDGSDAVDAAAAVRNSVAAGA